MSDKVVPVGPTPGARPLSVDRGSGQLLSGKVAERVLERFAAGATAVEVGLEFGVTPLEAYTCAASLLESRSSVWSEAQRRELLAVATDQLRLRIQAWLDSSGVFDKDLVRSALSVLREVATQLNESSRLAREDMSKVRDVNVEYMLSAVSAGFGAVRGVLEDKHPEVDLNELDAAFSRALAERMVGGRE